MIVFGPVRSRRLGRSLGVNNIPPKMCSYWCAYCQLGRTVKMRIDGQAPRGSPFEKTVLRSSLPGQLYSWSPWCTPRLITAHAGVTSQGTRGPPPGDQVECDRVLSRARPVRHHGHSALIIFTDGKEAGRAVGTFPKHVPKGKLEAVLWPQSKEGT